MTSLKPIALQLRLDAARTITGSSIITAFILPIAMSFASSMFVTPDFAFGITTVLFATETLTIGLSAPITEGVNDHKNINGIIPINRSHQVLGRYAFIFLSLIVAVICTAICWLFAEFVSQQSWSVSIGAACITVGILSLITALVVFPFFYAWNPAKIMQAFGIVLIALAIGIGILASVVPESWSSTLNSLTTWALSHPWAATGLGTATCALLTYASIMLSIHLLKRRQY
jgi:MFS family permease